MSPGIVHDLPLEIGHVFGLPIYWYGAVYSIGFLGVFAWFALRRQRLGWSLADAFELTVFMAAGILLGGRIFDILVARSGLDPSQMVFIDDRTDNVAAARQLGFTGLLFTEPDALAADLAAMGLPVSTAAADAAQ